MFTSHSWGQSGITCAYLGQPSFKLYYQHHSIRCSALSTLVRNRKTRRICIGVYAQMERFELSHRLSQSTPLAGEPLEPLGYICLCGFSSDAAQAKLAEREGFEPPVPFDITGFQDQRLKPLGHLSSRTSKHYYSMAAYIRQALKKGNLHFSWRSAILAHLSPNLASPLDERSFSMYYYRWISTRSTKYAFI